MKQQLHGKMKRGYMFTIDAALAVIIVTTLIFAMHFQNLNGRDNGLVMLQLQENLDDTFDLLDKRLVLQTMDKPTIEGKISSVMPINYGYKATIQEYRRQGSNNFSKTDEISIGNFSIDLNYTDYVKGRRLFLTFTTYDYNVDGGQGKAKYGEIDRFYNLEYTGWIK